MPEPTAATYRWRDHWPAAVVAGVAALVALWARHRLFPAYSWNRDEPVYLWHVNALREGHLTPPDGGYPELFRPWLSARGDGVFFTQYTLGWPLVLLAATVVTGAAGNALLLGAALAVIGTYAIGLELLRDRRIATLGAGLMVASPLLAIQGGVYLSYLFTLGLGLLFGTLLLSGLRLDRPLRLLVAGLLLGAIFMTRPYDAVLWGAAFAGYALIRDRARWTRLVRPFLVCGAGALPLVIATLAYNRHVTGGWLAFPITAADEMDTFGFGPKRLMPTFEIIDYDLAKALKGTAKNAFFLPWFLVGSYVGLLAAGLGLWQRRREPSTLALLLVCAVFPLGYFVFWGTHLSSLAARISGPIYLVPLYAPICLLVASVVVGWWPHRRRLAVGLLAALVVGTVPAAVSRFDVNRDISLRQEPWRRSVEDIEGRALVFVADTAPYLLYLNPFSSNGPELDDRILYASDTAPSMLDLIAAMPDRAPYLQQGSIAAQEIGPREDPWDLDVHLTPVEVRRGHTLTLSVTVSRPSDLSDAYVEITTGAGTYTQSFTDERAAADLTTSVTIVAPGSAGDGLALRDRGTISITVGFGSTPDRAAGAPRVREDLVYRVVDRTIEVLVPSAKRRNELVDHERQWRRTTALDELHVEVTSD